MEQGDSRQTRPESMAPIAPTGLVARALRYLLWLQLLFALGIAWWCHGYLLRLGMAPLPGVVLAMLLGVAGVFLLRIAITAHNFCLAAKIASPSPVKLTFWQYGRLFFAEFLSTMYSSSWGMHHCAFATGWLGESPGQSHQISSGDKPSTVARYSSCNAA